MCQACVCGGAHVAGIMDDLYLLFAPLLVVVFSVLYFGCQGPGSFSGHMVTLFVIHLLRSHKITSQMSPYQVFRNALLHISKLSGGHSHFTSCLGGAVVCVPSHLNTLMDAQVWGSRLHHQYTLHFPWHFILSSPSIWVTRAVFSSPSTCVTRALFSSPHTCVTIAVFVTVMTPLPRAKMAQHTLPHPT